MIAPFCFRLGFVISLILSTVAHGVHAGTVLSCDEAALRAAVSGGGTVTFGCDGTIVLGSTLVISNDTVLDGTGGNVVLSGSNAVRVLSVKSGVRLSILNLTIANGRYRGTNAVTGSFNGRGESAFGAAIYNDGGIVDLTNCALTNNSVMGGNGAIPMFGNSLGGAGGGAAVFNNGGTLNVTNSLFQLNRSVGEV
jgi:hypothetical protein